MQVTPPNIPVNPAPSPLHDYAELVRDALAIWGGISLIFIGIGKLQGWRNRRKERREHRLRQSIYRFLLDSNDFHSSAGVWAEVVIKPILDGVKLKYMVEYQSFPGWKIQLGILYWNIRVWLRKVGMTTENDVAAILADMHRNGEIEVARPGYYRVVNQRRA